VKTNRTEDLFSVNARTPPTMTVDSGEEFTVEAHGAFDDVEEISAGPTPFTPGRLSCVTPSPAMSSRSI
jgi:hypothetical protein